MPVLTLQSQDAQTLILSLVQQTPIPQEERQPGTRAEKAAEVVTTVSVASLTSAAHTAV